MKIDAKTITVNGVDYVPAEDAQPKAQQTDGMDYVICRADRTGVFAGYLEKREGTEVTLRNARRMWRWFGASLSECATHGTPAPAKCKFPCAVDKVLILDAIEILDCTEKARLSLEGVPVWSA